MGSMVGAAEAHQIGGVGGPAVLPVHQVADLQPAAAVAPRRHAAPITLLHGDAGARRDDALGSAHAEGHTMALPHRLVRPVAPQQAAQAVGQGRPAVYVGALTVADAQVNQELVALAVGAGLGGPGQRRLGHAHQGVCPADPGGRRLLGLAAVEQPVTALDQRLFHQGALVGGKVG